MIILAIGVDPFLYKLVLLASMVILLAFTMKILKQPSVIAYILVGVLVGPYGFEIITEKDFISSMGSLGLILLLFFVGMEMSLPSLFLNWKTTFIGTIIQVIISVLTVAIIGLYSEWPLNRIILVGFVISLSSSAVIFKLLEDKNLLTSPLGLKVSGILLAQDIIVVPMVISLNFLGGAITNQDEAMISVAGGVGIVVFLIWVLRTKEFNLPFKSFIKIDPELQVFTGLMMCFGFAFITALLGLSSALGAFVAGIVVSQSKSTYWFHASLQPFKVLFLALFFVSIGMLIQMDFLIANIGMIVLIIFLVFITNNIINAVIIRVTGSTWKESFYAGALLSQIGEFSFVLCSLGFHLEIITEYSYLLTVSVIALTLLFSTIWTELVDITLTKKIIKKRKKVLIEE